MVGEDFVLGEGLAECGGVRGVEGEEVAALGGVDGGYQSSRFFGKLF